MKLEIFYIQLLLHTLCLQWVIKVLFGYEWVHTIPKALPLLRSLSLSQSSTLGGHLDKNTPSSPPQHSTPLTSTTQSDQIQLREKAWRH